MSDLKKNVKKYVYMFAFTEKMHKKSYIIKIS